MLPAMHLAYLNIHFQLFKGHRYGKRLDISIFESAVSSIPVSVLRYVVIKFLNSYNRFRGKNIYTKPALIKGYFYVIISHRKSFTNA